MTKLPPVKVEGRPATLGIVGRDGAQKSDGLHVMLDLETFSQAPNASIISIGAVKFHPFDFELPSLTRFPDEFHQGILIASGKAFGLDVSGSTLDWWFDPARDEARKAWFKLEKLDLATVLDGFATWYGKDPLRPIWGNGAGFDNVILRSAYKATGLDVPWSYRADRDLRTMNALAPTLTYLGTNPDWGVAHDALYDARVQALRVQQIVSFLGLTTVS